jgi:hypothetical protein
MQMTELNKPVTRKITTVRGEVLVVTMRPEGIVIREPRRRAGYLLPYGLGFQVAVRLHVDAERREKARARKSKRGK